MVHRICQPNCESCGREMKSVGKLPPIGGRPVVFVFRCTECRRVASREPRKSATIDRRRLELINRLAPRS